jgi:NAD(P)-dependent dehydrogenase (short-subunit alcohol dehydrogenase family)
MKQTTSKVAIVTGCSSGFGLLACHELARAGFTVYPTMRNLSKRKELDGFEVLQLDVTDPDSIGRAVEKVMAEAGRIDVLVNNAGIGIGGFFEDLTNEEIRRQFETNFFGALEVTRRVLPVMRKQRGGRIINVSSIAGRFGTPILSGYVASKFALEGFSESLYHEVAHFGIDVILIEPGTYRTEIFDANRTVGKNALRSDSAYVEYMAPIERKINRLVEKSTADPREVARAIAHAATIRRPKPRYIMGKDAKLQAFLKWALPGKLLNSLVRRAIGL